MTERMMKRFVRFLRFCNRPWTKWPVIIIFVVAITVTRFVMAGRYGDSPDAPGGDICSIMQETYQT